MSGHDGTLLECERGRAVGDGWGLIVDDDCHRCSIGTASVGRSDGIGCR